MKSKSAKMLGIVGVIIAGIAGLLMWAVGAYNGMVTQEEELKAKWGNVQSAYQRRLDLIPNLVEVVKGYAAHESTTLQNVTNARVGLTDAYNEARQATDEADGTGNSVEKVQKAQERLNSQLGIYVNAVHEAYPDLKANTNFLDLQTQLEGTENRINTERVRYNEAVQAFNTQVRRFPNSFVASFAGFATYTPFEADAGASTAPKVSF